MAWVVIFVTAKALKLEKYGVEIKAYSLVYKNKSVNEVLIRILGRTRRSVKVFANVSVIAGFMMMAFAFYFLLNNISNFFVAPTAFSELTVLIPGITLTSAPATKICSTKPAAADEAAGAAYVITAAVVEVKAVAAVAAVAAKAAVGATPAVVAVVEVKEVKAVAAVAEVKGTFKCAAAGASYMTVGAAALIAAATLLQ